MQHFSFEGKVLQQLFGNLIMREILIEQGETEKEINNTKQESLIP